MTSPGRRRAARLAPSCSSSDAERVVLGIPEVAGENESERRARRRPAGSPERDASAERSIMWGMWGWWDANTRTSDRSSSL